MAVTKVVRIPDQRERSASTKDSLTETLVYHVHTDGATSGGQWTDTAANARVANDGTHSIPVPNSTIPVNGVGCLVQSVEAERMAETPLVFLVTVTCGIQPSGGEGTKFEITITVDGDEYSEPIFKDVNSKPIKNSCNQSYEPPLEKTYNERESMSINFKSDVVDVSTISATRGKVNDAEVTLHIAALGYSRTFAEKTLQLKKASYTVTIDNTGAKLYWSISYVCTYDPATWAAPIVDRGLYTLDPSGAVDSAGLPKLVPILDREGLPVTTPQFLNGSGQKLAAGANVHIDTYELYSTADFTALFTGL